MKVLELIGQTLDDKYEIERELGKGGMGAVYLATHVGTERSVAVKVIAPEFMRRQEFIERFRREARAAGRLRHPNVVDVTDFGIAETSQGSVAYLVMEYLDGCTLGEVLEEDKQLPLSWTLDILEQTCAAVHEAHRQGIIHRDLKPDNIWLEPNARGGYTVKVLDFGIAKLEETAQDDEEIHSSKSVQRVQNPKSKVQSQRFFAQTENQTLAMPSANNGDSQTLTFPANGDDDSTLNLPPEDGATLNLPVLSNDNNATLNLPNDFPEFGTIALDSTVNQTDDAETGTAIFEPARATHNQNFAAANQENVGTKILAATTTSEKDLSRETAALTRVGAVLGTPLYMSPEQCRGERLDQRADVYSLGIIAYQMLGGAPPFVGKYTEVLKAHQETDAPPLDAKKVNRKVKREIHCALAKNPDERPASALAFASRLRANSEGIGALFRKALAIYSEHLPVFVKLALLTFSPVLAATLAQAVLRVLLALNLIPETIGEITFGILAFVTPFVNIFCAAVLSAITTWLVAQLLAAPLRPVKLRPAFNEARKHLKTFAATVTIITALAIVALIVGMLPGAIALGFSIAMGEKRLAESPGLMVLLILASIIILLLGLLPGIYLFMRYSLVTSVVMMENLRGSRALKRSAQLVRRSFGTVAAVVCINFFVPLVLTGAIALFLDLAFRDAKLQPGLKIETSETNRDGNQAQSPKTVVEPTSTAPGIGDEQAAKQTVQINLDSTANVSTEKDGEDNRAKSLRKSLRETAFQVLWMPFLILITSLFSVVSALLYLKTRQAGGESLIELLAQFEDERPQRRWQRSIKNKLEQSGRQPSRLT